jgi:hypothetical protein
MEKLKEEEVPQKDRFGECGKRWKLLTDEEKKPFEEMVVEDKKREEDRKVEV